MHLARRLLANVGLIFLSLVATGLFFEFVVFRWVLLPSDIPRNVYSGGLVRYQPNRSGTYRIADDIAASFRINAQGWNSGIGDYKRERTPGRLRIAIIGDSYVEALQVPHDLSLAEQTQSRLESAGMRAEVFRFAISGAPLSQYLQILRQEVVDYRPDLVVINMVHNDFEESFRYQSGRYTSSFLKVKLEDAQPAQEIPPVPYEETWKDWVRQRATVRYLYYRRQISPATIRSWIFSEPGAAEFQANVEVGGTLAALPAIERATDYIFTRLKEVQQQSGFEILLTMDAVREQIYTDEDLNSGIAALNKLAMELAEKCELPFIDLTEAFTVDWRKNGQRFEFASDGHWNQRGHAVAAGEIAAFVLSRSTEDSGKHAGR